LMRKLKRLLESGSYALRCGRTINRIELRGDKVEPTLQTLLHHLCSLLRGCKGIVL
jgi:hypothetical protein